jgi:hypothetical protein
MSNYTDRAAAIIEAAEAKAAADLAELIRILPDELARMPADEHREYLRARAAKLRQWRQDHYQHWFDLPKYGREKITAWLCAWMRDEAAGYQTPMPADIVGIVRIAEWLKADAYLKHIAKLMDAAPAPKQPQVFGDDLAEIIRPALAELELLNDAGQFIGKAYHVKAIYNVLKRRGYILGNAKAPEKTFAAFFADRFGNSVGDRTLREPPTTGQDEAERDLLLMIPRKP